MKKIILLLACSSVLLISCKKDFLNVEDRSTITLPDYVVDLSTTNEFLNGTLTALSHQAFRGYGLVYADLVADNVKPVTPAVAMAYHYNWAQVADDVTGFTAGSLNSNGAAYETYKVINSANIALAKIEEFKNEDPAKADALKGRALFVRAICHFFILHMYAQAYNFTPDGSHPGIPYVTSPYRLDPAPRLPVKEVYANLISDLQGAIALIPVSITSTLLPTRNAAKAMLARVFLFKGDFAAAKSLAREVIQAVPLMTTNYPTRLYTTQDTESLFLLSPGFSTSLVNGFVSVYPGTYYRRTSLQFLATGDIAGILKENPADKRMAWIKDTLGNTEIRKFPQGVVADVSPASGSYYFSVIRSSEMYLTAAEAYAQLNNVDSAVYFLDAVRKRADSNVPVTAVTGTALLDSVYKERRKELAFEGFRMYDLMRWKKGVNRVDAPPGVQTLSYPSPKAICPLSTVDVQVAGTIQNPGY